MSASKKKDSKKAKVRFFIQFEDLTFSPYDFKRCQADLVFDENFENGVGYRLKIMFNSYPFESNYIYKTPEKREEMLEELHEKIRQTNSIIL